MHFSEILINGFAITTDDIQIGNSNNLEGKVRTQIQFEIRK